MSVYVLNRAESPNQFSPMAERSIALGKIIGFLCCCALIRAGYIKLGFQPVKLIGVLQPKAVP